MSTPRFALVHLFATGPCKKGHGLLQLGLLPLEPNARSQEWVFNPQERYGDRLYRRTLVANDKAAQAPTWEQCKAAVQAELSQFDYLFFFHESHEESWLQQVVLGGMPRRPVCADVALLTAFFCPDNVALDTEELVAAAKGGKPAAGKPLHRILSALREQVLLILDRLTESTPSKPDDADPGAPLFVQLLEQALALKVNFPVGAWQAVRAAARHANDLKDADLFSAVPPPRLPSPQPVLPQHLRQVFRQWLPPKPEEEAAKPRTELTAPSDQIVADALQSWCKAHGLQKREAQTEYAQFCNRALTQPGLYLAEAGTGTGKTIGYLVAAAELIRVNPGHKVVVATATKNLQDQVIRGEIPRLKFKGGLHEDLTSAVLKGKNNYICLTALLEQYDELLVLEKGNVREGLGWLYLCLRLRYTAGEAEEIPASLRTHLPTLLDLLGEVNAQEMCVANLCVDIPGCVYARQLEHAHAADVIVTNHHKLLQMPPKLEEKIKFCIIDEADQFPDNARNAMSTGFRPRVVWFRLIRPLLGGPARKGYLTLLEEKLASDKEHPLVLRMGEEIAACCQLCDALTRQFKALSELPIPDGEQRWQEPVRVLIGGQYKPRDFGPQILAGLQQAQKQLEQLAGRLHTMHELGKQLEDWSLGKFLGRLEGFRERATDLSVELASVCEEFPSRDWVHVIEKNRVSWGVCRIPYSLRSTMDTVRKTYESVLFTSATLYVAGTTDYFRYQLDLEEPLTQELKRLSPFNYESQARTVAPVFLPSYGYHMTPAQKEAWLESACQVMLSQIIMLNGRTLVLFTSREDLEFAYRWLAPYLQRYDIELLKQEGSSLWEIRRFRREEQSVLLGLERMWSGVDFPGATLSQVIVLRLPNPSLGMPLVAHRKTYEGARFWTQYYHPTGRHKFRQGFGRLIRREKDKGVFVVLDSRLVVHPNMGHFQQELPTPVQRLTDQAQLQAWTVHTLLPELELKSEWERRNISLHDLPSTTPREALPA